VKLDISHNTYSIHQSTLKKIFLKHYQNIKKLGLINELVPYVICWLRFGLLTLHFGPLTYSVSQINPCR